MMSAELEPAAADSAPAPTTSWRGLIVVPTFNEALNLPILVPRILAADLHADVLIVDDGSPDGTGQVAETLAQELTPRVQVLHRSSKSGRGGAVLAGFRHSFTNEAYAWFGEMDADLSHQPEELPHLIDAISRCDLVVGTRYLPGGRIEGWSLRRRVWSRASNAIIRRVLGVPLSDYTNGYRLYSRRAVRLLLDAPLRETGYISLSEWAFEVHGAGMEIAQVPTVFINRRYGQSNMSAAEALAAVRALLRMRGWLRPRTG